MKFVKHNFSLKALIAEIFRLIFLSLTLGLLLAGFFNLTVGIENERAYLIYLPLLFPLILLLQKNTQSRCRQVSQSVKLSLVPNRTDFLTCLYVFSFTILSYICGASVGREGSCVIMAEALKPKNSMKEINWKFILASMGFAGALGSFWMGPLFYLEVFSLKLKHEFNGIDFIFAFLGSAMVCGIMSLFHVSYFSLPIIFKNSWLQHEKFYVFLVLIIMIVGTLAFTFKKMYKFCSVWFQTKSVPIQLIFALVVGAALLVPQLRIFQGLGLDLVDRPYMGSMNSLFIGTGKMLATVLCLSLGFLGGEFVPAIIIGSNFGQLASYFSPEYILLGSVLGFFLFFGCITRLYWVCILACALYFGWQIGIVFSIVLWCALKISGTESVYFDN